MKIYDAQRAGRNFEFTHTVVRTLASMELNQTIAICSLGGTRIFKLVEISPNDGDYRGNGIGTIIYDETPTTNTSKKEKK